MSMTKHQLSTLLFAQMSTVGSPTLTIGGHTGILQSIRREDGSGRSFLLELRTNKGLETVYVRTVD